MTCSEYRTFLQRGLVASTKAECAAAFAHQRSCPPCKEWTKPENVNPDWSNASAEDIADALMDDDESYAVLYKAVTGEEPGD